MSLRGGLLLTALALLAVGCDSKSTAGDSCGDGVIAGLEECDDGAGNSDTAANACRSDCTLPGCGDGVVDAGEYCDPPTAGSCDSSCQRIPGCGDAVVDSGEQCDPPDGTTCDASCLRIPTCGDGFVDGAEECDDATANSDVNPDACRTNCTAASCGDGVVDTVEECDDASGNDDTTPDACRTNCMDPDCGDGVIDTGEGCDPPNSDTCTNRCTRIPQNAGGPCQLQSDCIGWDDTPPTAACYDESTGWPSGYCGQGCTTQTDCPSRTRCTNFLVGFFCAEACLQQSDCRTGYSCVEWWMYDNTLSTVCAADCTQNSDCPDTGFCNVHSGFCAPDQGLLRTGEPCINSAECEGVCIVQNQSGVVSNFVGGYCGSWCNTTDPTTCPTGEVCSAVFSGVNLLGVCLEGCSSGADCRQADGYTCQQNPNGGGTGMVCYPQ